MERLGYQLDGAARNRVLIMPFLTDGAEDTGILPGHWRRSPLPFSPPSVTRSPDGQAAG